MKTNKQKREGLIGHLLNGALIETVVEILREGIRRGNPSFLISKAGQNKPAWVFRHDVVEIKRLPRPTCLPEAPKALTRVEMREYAKLYKEWVKNGKAGLVALSGAKLQRLVELADRLSLCNMEMMKFDERGKQTQPSPSPRKVDARPHRDKSSEMDRPEETLGKVKPLNGAETREYERLWKKMANHGIERFSVEEVASFADLGERLSNSKQL